MLPDKVCELLLMLDECVFSEICEIRLRENAPVSLSTYKKNLFLKRIGGITNNISDSVILDSKDVSFVMNRLCEGSVYRYMSTVNSGYIVTSHGVRAGVCGECVYDSGKISAVSKFNSINLRIPHEIESSGDILSRYIIKNPYSSVLLCSPPGFGKTTVIRSVAKSLATGKFAPPKRVSVIDERGEILPTGAVGLIDRFSGYRKSDGIEIAARLFSPELIICDEIGHSDDTEALLSVQNNGVPLIATTHGKSISDAIMRPNIKKLVDAKVFDAFALIEKTENGSRIAVGEEIK
jgi:stage III sporulation protein AA